MSDTQIKELQPAPDFTLPAIGSDSVSSEDPLSLNLHLPHAGLERSALHSIHALRTFSALVTPGYRIGMKFGSQITWLPSKHCFP